MRSRNKIILLYAIPLVFALLILAVLLHTNFFTSSEESIEQKYNLILLILSCLMVGLTATGYILTQKMLSKYEEAHNHLQEAHRALDERVIDRTTELAKSESKYKALFDNAEISIWNEDLSLIHAEMNNLREEGVGDLVEYLLLNPDLAWELAGKVQVKHVNLATLTLFEAETEEQILVHIEKTFGPGAIEVFIQELCAIWRGEKHFRALTKFVTLKGREFDAIVSLNIPQRAEDYANVPFTIIDISESVRANEELKRSEERLNEAQHLAHVGSWELDHATYKLRWSPEVFSIFEISPEEFRGSYESYLAMVHPDDRELADQAFQNSIAHKEKYDVVHRILLRDGTIKYVNQRCNTTFVDGVPRVSNGTVHDITKRTLAEMALRESEKRFRSYIESAPLAIFVTNRAGELTDANSLTSKLTGLPLGQLLTMAVKDFTYADDQWHLFQSFQRVMKKGSSSVEVRFILPDETIRYMVIDTVKLSDSHYLSFANDVTEKRELESQLRQSEKMRAIGQLAGGIAHDFNNQLTGILGYAELLYDELKRESCDSVHFVNDIIRGVHRASNLTSQLLAFSRKGKYLSKVVNVHELVEEVCRLLVRTIDKKITIQKGLNASPATTKGDPTQLQNAILNLALNARDALPDGGVIEFHTMNELLSENFLSRHSLQLEPGEYLLVTVADTGIGMDESTRMRIFEPFFTTKEQGKGTGMGLAAVYGTIKSHNGAIFVESAPGKGTLFSIYLPLAVGDSDEDTFIMPVPVKNPRSATILIVDDDETVRSVVARMLEKSGYTVYLCEDGLEAVDYYRQHWQDIDLVILDLVMPVMGGKKAFPLLKEINEDVKVLVSSGYSLEGEAQSVIEAGAEQFIQKPFKKDVLVATIHDILKDT